MSNYGSSASLRLISYLLLKHFRKIEPKSIPVTRITCEIASKEEKFSVSMILRHHAWVIDYYGQLKAAGLVALRDPAQEDVVLSV